MHVRALIVGLEQFGSVTSFRIKYHWLWWGHYNRENDSCYTKHCKRNDENFQMNHKKSLTYDGNTYNGHR